MTVKDFIDRDKDGLVGRAYRFAKTAHVGQKRATGEPYFVHPLAAANSVAEWGLDEETVAAALLHDVAEDTKYTTEDISREFGEDIAFLVDGVTKIKRIKYRGVEDRVENLRKFVLYLSKDLRVLLVRLADRLNNMRTLYALHPRKQKRIALETMEIYAPLAYRLGMQKLSGELEDLSFPYIYPEEYKWLIEKVKSRYEEREEYAGRVQPMIAKELEKNKIQHQKIESRAKRYTSLYKKLLRYDMDIDSIYDLVAIRVIVNDIEDCYATLGIIHKTWPPVPHRFKDYIALPKPNGYRSLHTTVFGPENKITEIQIKTDQMHQEAEFGIAAHFAYQALKDTKDYVNKKAAFADKKELAWIQQLQNWQNNVSSEEDFIKSLKIDFFQDRILAITPMGEVLDLPAGATPVDFAYQIHSEVGNQCSGAKVNGKIAPLSSELRSGDVVEILTQKGKNPSEDWLEFVKTSHAKSYIRSATRKSGKSLVKRDPTKLVLKVTIGRDRQGLIRDITSVISRSHINIIDMHTTATIMKINCEVIDRKKAEKISDKIKKLPGIREVSYHYLI